MASPSRSGAELRAPYQLYHPIPEYMENRPQLSTRTQAEIQRYREFSRPIVPTRSPPDDRRQSSVYRLQPVAGDSWRQYDEDDDPACMPGGEWRPPVSSQYELPPIRYPYPKHVLPPIQSLHTSYSHPSEPPIRPPVTHRGSSPRLYSLSQNPMYSRPGASPRPQRSSFSCNRPSPQTTYRALHHGRSPQEQYSYSSLSGPPTQPQYSSLQVGSSLNLPFPSHLRAGPSSRPPLPSHSQFRQSSPLPHSSQQHHSSFHTGPSSRLPDSPYLELGGSQRPDPPFLQPTPLVSPYALPPPVVLDPSRRPDIHNLLSDPLDQSEVQERSLDWLLQEAQRQGIDVKAILISHLFPQPIPSNNQPHLLRDESLMRNRKRYFTDDDIGASPRSSKRREIENQRRGCDRNEDCSVCQNSSHRGSATGEPVPAVSLGLQPRARVLPHGSGSSLHDSERESSEETARNYDSDSQNKSISRDEVIIQNKNDRSFNYSRSISQGEGSSPRESDRNSSYNETKSLDENSNQDQSSIYDEIPNQIESSTHYDSIHHNQSAIGIQRATHRIIAEGSEVEELPFLRQTKTNGKRKLGTIVGSDGDSGPSSSKRPKIRSCVEVVRHNENRHEGPRPSDSKDSLKDKPVDAAPDNTIRDNKANPESRGLLVPLRRSSRIPKTRIRSS